jgi:hypothetical protein
MEIYISQSQWQKNIESNNIEYFGLNIFFITAFPNTERERRERERERERERARERRMTNDSLCSHIQQYRNYKSYFAYLEALFIKNQNGMVVTNWK